MRKFSTSSITIALLLAVASLCGCQSAPKAEWALAIHGGAGVISHDRPESERVAYRESLTAALETGREILDDGGTSLDAVEAVIRLMEENPLFNAGKGAVFTNAETCELDASIMNGADLNCGAVSGITTVRSPITLARRVMENSRHVFLIGSGAEQFAREQGLTFVDNTYFQTERRREALKRAKAREANNAAMLPNDAYGTVGAVALDRHGNLAAATSTGGMTNKRFGRVGDSPIVGAGTFADNTTCAVSCTGTGELFIRHGVARDVAARMQYAGASLRTAADQVIHDVLSPGDGGLIAVGSDGAIVFSFNSQGMFRGAADSNGRFDVGIWEAMNRP